MGSNEGNTREQPVRTGKPLGQDVSTRYVLRVGVWMPCKWAVIPNFKTGGPAERISVPEYNICIPGLFCAQMHKGVCSKAACIWHSELEVSSSILKKAPESKMEV